MHRNWLASSTSLLPDHEDSEDAPSCTSHSRTSLSVQAPVSLLDHSTNLTEPGNQRRTHYSK